ncbi:DUF2834 domain-containing protein [Aureibacter tunicatorum]|uniref:Magnesium-transporting ATPase (P-type) n=1 Tax=Aureibacter tunicatorum TaxID=866807 RepID=A0AAE3XN19_9BACT|nr:DUF2834 domain-containing protein [Aureibacter tunicatorum]MDR6240936.1 magnesium-transporting ATPase (P-type) [Aureibacter tunicatorum]BDD03716.1 hypothetical protein AUTU_11990 [Aureibacter tunicatorum]
MRNVYLILAILGFVLPNALVLIESLETGNYLLYADPISTFESMTANRIATIFSIDLMFAVIVFFIWTYKSSIVLLGRKKIFFLWGVTMIFGFACGLPLYLYMRLISNELNYTAVNSKV